MNMTLTAQATMGIWLGAASVYLFRPKLRRIADSLLLLGVVLGMVGIGWLWNTLERPPLRTLGETRWWYAVLVPTLGALIGWRFQTRVLAAPACLMGALFASINLRHPEYMDKTLMPALQSPWFVPHVVVYMLAYSALGLSCGVAAWNWGKRRLRKEAVGVQDVELPHRLVLVGLPLLTCGLLFGAFWAKEAWGHYWTWDPKETWAFLTWSAYLVYLHVRLRHALQPKLNLSLLVVGFLVLMVCWFGVNYLPVAQESVHTYTDMGN